MSLSQVCIIVGVLWLAAAAILITHFLRKPKRRIVVRLAGFTWTREDFCRGWLITGDTGSGKTRSGITPLLFQVFQNEPTWGGLCIDDKGIFWETLSQMAKHFGRENDLILRNQSSERIDVVADGTSAQTPRLEQRRAATCHRVEHSVLWFGVVAQSIADKLWRALRRIRVQRVSTAAGVMIVKIEIGHKLQLLIP